MKSTGLFQKTVKIILVSLVLFSVYPRLPAQAAALTSVKDTLTRIKAATTADHTVQWTLPTGITFDASDKARVDFPTDFVTAGTWVAGDFTFNDGTGRTIIDVGNNADPTCTAGVNNVAIKVIPADDQFEIWACATYVSSGAAAAVTFTIDGTAADGTLTNPGAANNLVVAIIGDDKGDGFGANDDINSLALSIISEDQVTVTATVDPTFTFALSATTCALGTLTLTTVQTCSVTLTTTTNADGGYTTTVVGVVAGADLIHSNGSDAIDDATGVEVNASSEEFGIGTSDSGVDIVTEADCAGADNGAVADAQAITNTAQSVASNTVPVAAEATTACFAASAAAITTAGAYSATTTFISTGTF
jgi:hypothetical protein